MNYLKQALTEYLSGLTTKKNEKEIWTKGEYVFPITVEAIDDECCIIRSYGKDGQLLWEGSYKNDQQHGFSRHWYENGQLELEIQYKNDQQHGFSRYWYENGQLELEIQYKNDKRNGLYKVYDELGQIEREEIWENGKLIEE